MSDAFVPVATLADLAPGEAIDVAVGDLEIALVRDEDGGVHALEDICSHEEIALSDGDVEGCTIECWKHVGPFAAASGRRLPLPAVRPVRVFPGRSVGSSGECVADPTAAPATCSPPGHRLTAPRPTSRIHQKPWSRRTTHVDPGDQEPPR